MAACGKVDPVLSPSDPSLMGEFEYQKYITTVEGLKETVEKYGVAIIPNVLHEDECEKMVREMWEYFEHITQKWPKPIKRDDESSWSGFYKLKPKHSMLIQNWSAGQSQCSWNVRQNPKIVEIFAKFWGCDEKDLIVSFDGLSFYVPPEVTHKGWHTETWYHCDQSFTRNAFECLQSWVTGLDVNKGDATLAFFEGSHRLHKEFATAFDIKRHGDWYKLNRDEEQFYLSQGCAKKRMWCPKGSMVFWDSRTIHCGTEALAEREMDNFRSVVYLCYQPRTFAKTRDLLNKQEAIKHLETMSHYPCAKRTFPKIPKARGDLPTVTPIPKPVLTPLGRRLAGYKH